MDDKTQRELESLHQKIQKVGNDLRTRIAAMLSRKGGHVEGQIAIDGHIQLMEQSSAPAAGTGARLYLIDDGGTLKLIAKFPNGSTATLGQES